MNDSIFFHAVQYFGQIELLLLLLALIVPLFLVNRERSPTTLLLVVLASFAGVVSSSIYLAFLGGAHVVFFDSEVLPWLTLEIDMLSAIFLLLTNIVAFCASWFGIHYSTHLGSHVSRPLMHGLTALFVFGMLGVMLSTTPLAFMLFWEVMSVASFVLVLTERTEAAVRAGLFYFIMTQLGAIAITMGFAVVSNGNFFAPFAYVPLIEGGVYLPFILFLIGFGSKAGLVPLHAWLPLAHPEAPSHISALMSGAMLKVALFGFFLVFTKILPPLPLWCGLIVIVVGITSALYGVINAITEKDIKTMLAWSSIENIGLLFTMIGVAMYAGARGHAWLVLVSLSIALYMALNHALFKSGLFMVAGVLAHRLGTRNINNMGGLAKQMPLFSAVVLVLCLASAALPPSGAFFGEWAFMRTLFFSFTSTMLVDRILYISLFALIALVGGLGVFAMIKFYGIAFLGQSRAGAKQEHIKPNRLQEVTPIGLATMGTLLMGIGAPWVFALLLGDDSHVLGDTMSFSGFLTQGFLYVTLAVFLILLLAYFLHRFFIAPANTRIVDTWDCGQPITSRMEYTGTGFAAPIRFFFLSILQSNKSVVRTNVLPTNNYFRATSVQIIENPLFDKVLYAPTKKAIGYLSVFVRKLHGGAIGAYFVVMMLTLIIALSFVLWNN